MVFKSTFPDVHPPERFKDSLAEFFWHQLDVFADKCLFVYPDGKRQHTGAQIKDQTRRIARYLVDELGVVRGDSCVFFYRNSDHIHLAALGAIFAGASVCNWYEKDPAHEHLHMLKCMRPKLVFVDAELHGRMVEMRRDNPELDFKICIVNEENMESSDGNDRNWIKFKSEMLAYEPMSELEAKSKGKQLPIEVSGSDSAYVLLTSGSTGLPKPVARSHRNSLYVCYSFTPENSPWHMDSNTVLCGHLPLDHGTGTFSIKMTLTKGAKLVILDGHFDLERILEAVTEFSITDCMLGSAYLHSLTQLDPSYLAKYNLSSLKNIVSIGSRLASHASNVNLMQRFPGLSIRQAYGMTEAGFISVVPAQDAQTDGTTCGLLLPNVRIQLKDRETGAPIDQRELEGELYVTSPTVSPGYIGEHLAEQSRAAFLDDGYYRSYDICFMTSTDRLVTKGRYTEILCFSDGWKVLPAELEHTICSHPMVKEAAVIGLPHPTLATLHVPRAFVVPTDDAHGKLSGQEIFDYTAKLLSEPKHLTGGVVVLDSLPRTSIGKVDKKVLRSMEYYSVAAAGNGTHSSAGNGDSCCAS